MAQSPIHQFFNTKLMILPAILIAALFVSPAFSTSRSLFENNGLLVNGFRIDLTRIDSMENYTKHELIERAIKRGRQRLARLRAMISPNSRHDIRSPVHEGQGEFFMDLAIGTPPLPYSAIMDTGSDLIWTQCQPCIQCYNQSTPIFNPEKSSTFSKVGCRSKFCELLTVSECQNGCIYLYGYGDESTTEGAMAMETFTFGKHSVRNIGFGCGIYNHMSGDEHNAGLVGLGRGPLSLVSQLGLGVFSYCLTPIDANKKSSLLFGRLARRNSSINASTKTIPLIKNPKGQSFYYLSLKGISVGGNLLPIPKSAFAIKKDGSGGLILDSGTSFTMLQQPAYQLVRSAFVAQINLPTVDNQLFDLCFSVPSDGIKNLKVPRLVFHFDGANLALPRENYMILDSGTGLYCLGIDPSDETTVFGNYQQQNMLVVHDLKKNKVSFTHAQCDKL